MLMLGLLMTLYVFVSMHVIYLYWQMMKKQDKIEKTFIELQKEKIALYRDIIEKVLTSQAAQKAS